MNRGNMNFIAKNIRQYSMFIALLLIMTLAHILTKGLFLTPRNLNNLFLQTGYIAVLAIGMVMVIVGGQIDLAVGSIAAFCAAIAAFLQVRYNVGTVWVLLLALIIGMAVGTLQGAIIAYAKVPAFIVTLAGMMFFRGAVLAITSGNTLGPFLDSFYRLGSGYLPDIMGGGQFNVTALVLGFLLIVLLVILQVNKRKKRIEYKFEVLSTGFFIAQQILLAGIIAFFAYNLSAYKGIPYTIIIVALFFVLYSYITQHTKIGRSVYAIGGNTLAAELSGINVKFTTMMTFISMGVLSAVSGMLIAARMNSASPSTGTSFELEAIAASYVGGVSSRGGVGTVTGAVIGALVIASINNCMSLLNAEVWLQYMVKGIVLVIAVLFDIMIRKKRG